MTRIIAIHKLRWALVLALTVGLTSIVPRSLAADDLTQSSLNKAPANASFYVASFKLGELVEKVSSSKAYAKLMSIPSVQAGIAMAMQQWENPSDPNVAQFKQMLADPANQQLIELLKDGLSQEVFVYGDEDLIDALDVLVAISDAANAGQMEAMENMDFENMQAYQTRYVLKALDEQGAKMKIPTIVKGMKLSDTQRALDQMTRLETIAKQQLAQMPPQLQSLFKREQIGGGDFLTVNVSGALLPWPMILQSSNLPDDAKQKVVETITPLTAAIAIGVKDDYLLFSIGADTSHLASLGQGDTLLNSPRLAPVRDAGDKSFTGISTVSSELMKRVSSVDRQMDQMVTMVKTLGPMLLGGAPQLLEELVADVERFAEYVKEKVPEPGDTTSYSFSTPEGYESFSYSWAVNPNVDATQELSILNHVGGTPIMFFAARGKSNPEDFDDIATGLSRAGYYAEQIAAQQLPPDKLATMDRLKQDMLPLMKRLGDVTRDKLVPGFADSQSAIVLDAKSTSETWHVMMPSKTLPMLELGFVMGVSDRQLVKEGFTEYYAVAQEMIDKLHEASTGDLADAFPEPIPAIQLASPDTREISGGTVYFHKTPAETGLDPQVAINAGLTDKVAVASLLPQFTARLMADTPLQGAGPLSDTQRPLGAAFHFDFAGLLTAISPWIDYGMDLSGGMEQSPMGNIKQQAQDVVEVLQCFRGVSGVTYVEGNVTVTHAQWRFQDLD